jgi:hypothetical protein
LSDASRIIAAIRQLEAASGQSVKEFRTANGLLMTTFQGIPIVVDRECPPNQWYFVTERTS